MRMPWHKSQDRQLDLLGTSAEPMDRPPMAQAAEPGTGVATTSKVETIASTADVLAVGPLRVATDLLDEDPNNPRTEFPESELDELAESITQHGILEPIVVHPADPMGHYRVHFGAKRLRAARRAQLQEVPIVVRDAATDRYAQVAENQKRHGLSPLDLARFIKGEVDAGHSNAMIARRLGINLTSVAHHLALLDLPPELEQAFKSGRCTSPRTLHELSQLHQQRPEQARALMASDETITRTAVEAMRASRSSTSNRAANQSSAASLLAHAHAACARLEQSLTRLQVAKYEFGETDLATLRQRIAALAARLT